MRENCEAPVPQEPDTRRGRSMPPAILRGRRPGSRKIRRALSSHRPALIPGQASSQILCSTRPHARRIGTDQGCGPAGNPAAQPLNQPSRRTLFLRALGQCSRGYGLMHENTAGRGVCRCLASLALGDPVAANDGPTGALDLSRKCWGKLKAGLCGRCTPWSTNCTG
jgi:hypothetical protein